MFIYFVSFLISLSRQQVLPTVLDKLVDKTMSSPPVCYDSLVIF